MKPVERGAGTEAQRGRHGRCDTELKGKLDRWKAAEESSASNKGRSAVTI
jgi:hypothetical protein